MEQSKRELMEAVDGLINKAIKQLNDLKIPSVPELIKLLELQKELKREDVKFVTALWIEPEN